MANDKPGASEVLSIRLGAQTSLDLVWEGGVCLLVLVKKGVLHTRTVARLEPEQAMAAARFMARVAPLAMPMPLPPPLFDDDVSDGEEPGEEENTPPSRKK